MSISKPIEVEKKRKLCRGISVSPIKNVLKLNHNYFENRIVLYLIKEVILHFEHDFAQFVCNNLPVSLLSDMAYMYGNEQNLAKLLQKSLEQARKQKKSGNKEIDDFRAALDKHGLNAITGKDENKKTT